VVVLYNIDNNIFVMRVYNNKIYDDETLMKTPRALLLLF
jgi:hypothetical protein